MPYQYAPPPAAPAYSYPPPAVPAQPVYPPPAHQYTAPAAPAAAPPVQVYAAAPVKSYAAPAVAAPNPALAAALAAGDKAAVSQQLAAVKVLPPFAQAMRLLLLSCASPAPVDLIAHRSYRIVSLRITQGENFFGLVATGERMAT